MSKRHPKHSPTSLFSTHLPISFLGVLFFIALFVISLVYQPESLPLSHLLSRLSKYPYSPHLHLELATFYQTTEDYEKSWQELELTRHLSKYNSDNVMGTIDVRRLEEKILLSPQERQTHNTYWLEVLMKHPNYRDAYVQLLYSAYNGHDTQLIAYYRAKIKALDPNFEELPEQLLH